MKINNTTNPEALKAYGSHTAQQSQAVPESGKSQPVSIQDKVDISSKVRMFQDIKKAALDAPEVRMEKVTDVGQKIQTGTYRPDYTLVADKLLSSDISLKI